MREEVKCFILPKSAPQLPGWSSAGTSYGGNQRENETFVSRLFLQQQVHFKDLPAIVAKFLSSRRTHSAFPTLKNSGPKQPCWGALLFAVDR